MRDKESVERLKERWGGGRKRAGWWEGACQENERGEGKRKRERQEALVGRRGEVEVYRGGGDEIFRMERTQTHSRNVTY